MIEHKEHRKYFFAINSEDWFLEISFAKVQKEWRNRMNDLISRSRLIEEMKNDLALKYTGDVTVNFINGMIARQNEYTEFIEV